MYNDYPLAIAILSRVTISVTVTPVTVMGPAAGSVSDQPLKESKSVIHVFGSTIETLQLVHFGRMTVKTGDTKCSKFRHG